MPPQYLLGGKEEDGEASGASIQGTPGCSPKSTSLLALDLPRPLPASVAETPVSPGVVPGVPTTVTGETSHPTFMAPGPLHADSHGHPLPLQGPHFTSGEHRGWDMGL